MKPKTYSKGLDLCKCLSALVVLFYHFSIEGLRAGVPTFSFAASQPLARLVECACDLFFLTSGFALWLGWGRGGQLGRYYRRRAVAIYPMFWLGFFALFGYGEVLHGNNPDVPRWRVIFSVLGLDGYLSQVTVTFYKIGEWFLGCLILLYLVFPLLAWLLRRPAGRRVLAAACLILWAVWPLVCPAGFAPRHTMLGSLPVFCAGMALAPAWQQDRLQKAGPIAALAAAAALALLLWQSAAAPWLGPAASVLLFCALLWAGEALPAGLCRVLHGMARENYGVFLVHHVFLTLVWLRVMNRFGLGPVPGLLLYVPLCYGLAFVLRWAAKPVAWALEKLLTLPSSRRVKAQ